MLISILAAALNYALTGQGLKENIIKITKALIFFFIVIFAYPQIISFITHWTFNMAHASTFGRIESSVLDQRTMMVDSLADTQGQGTYSQQMMDQMDNAMDFFGGELLRTRRFANITYTVVAPAAAMAKVFMGSVGSSLKEAGLARGGNLTRSLLASGGSSGGGGGTGAGINRHDNRQKFLNKPTENGEKQTFREYLQGRKNQGADRGLNYMAKKEAASASAAPESKDPDYKAAMSELNKEFPGSGKRA